MSTEGNLNRVFKNNDVPTLEKIKKVGLVFASSRLLNSEEKVRPSTSYLRPSNKPEDNLIKVLHIVNVASEMIVMTDKLCHNDVPAQVVRIYTEVPVEFEIWKHENSVFWAQLVHVFYERLAEKVRIREKFMSDEEQEQGEGNEEEDPLVGPFIVTNWSVN